MRNQNGRLEKPKGGHAMRGCQRKKRKAGGAERNKAVEKSVGMFITGSETRQAGGQIIIKPRRAEEGELNPKTSFPKANSESRSREKTRRVRTAKKRQRGLEAQMPLEKNETISSRGQDFSQENPTVTELDQKISQKRQEGGK